MGTMNNKKKREGKSKEMWEMALLLRPRSEYEERKLGISGL